MIAIPCLTDDNIHTEILTEDDLPLMLAIREENVEYYSHDEFHTVEEFKVWFYKWEKWKIFWTVVYDGQKVGHLSLMEMEPGVIFWTNHLLKAYTGLGIGSRFAQMYIDWFIACPEVTKLTSSLFVSNTHAVAYNEKFGFTVTRKWVSDRGDEMLDMERLV